MYFSYSRQFCALRGVKTPEGGIPLFQNVGLINDVNKQMFMLRYFFPLSIISLNLSEGSLTSMVLNDNQFVAQIRQVLEQVIRSLVNKETLENSHPYNLILSCYKNFLGSIHSCRYTILQASMGPT